MCIYVVGLCEPGPVEKLEIFYDFIFILDATSPFCEEGVIVLVFSFARTQNSEVGVVKRAASWCIL